MTKSTLDMTDAEYEDWWANLRYEAAIREREANWAFVGKAFVALLAYLLASWLLYSPTGHVVLGCVVLLACLLFVALCLYMVGACLVDNVRAGRRPWDGPGAGGDGPAGKE